MKQKSLDVSDWLEEWAFSQTYRSSQVQKYLDSGSSYDSAIIHHHNELEINQNYQNVDFHLYFKSLDKNITTEVLQPFYFVGIFDWQEVKWPGAVHPLIFKPLWGCIKAES